MAWEHREGQFSVFPNEYKEDGDNKPDLRGDGLFNGESVEIALWWKDGRKGRFLSGQIKSKADIVEKRKADKFSRHEDEPEPTQGRSLRDGIDDEVPF